MPVCCVSVDVDSIACYYRIHGLGTPPDELSDVVIQRCVPRFADLLQRRGIEATFFVVGRDVDPDVGGDPARACRAVIAGLAAAGHEIASHSYSHPYDLARWPAARVSEEIERAHDVLSELAGDRIAGFRAPGYDVSGPMLGALARLGYRYDSSILPAPAYYAAKAAVMAAMKVAGRPSGAVLTNPRALLAPPDPYRPAHDAPWRRGDAPLIELPIAVTPGARIPAIGTSLLLAPAWLRRQLVVTMARRPLFNFELHGIDLADATADRIPAELIARQPDLRAPLGRKLAALEHVLDVIETRFELATLDQAASELQSDL